MIDIVYIIATVGFFALMLLYVAGCDYIGRRADVERADEAQPGGTASR